MCIWGGWHASDNNLANQSEGVSVACPMRGHSSFGARKGISCSVHDFNRISDDRVSASSLAKTRALMAQSVTSASFKVITSSATAMAAK